MKEKAKEFMKKYLIGFILGVVSAGTIAVYAETYFPSNDVTYDNKESGLSATNVQSAIDELYNVCFPPKSGGDIIEELVPTNPEELYKDENGDTRYYGKNPNNYISFNDELWRIIGVFDGKIKIIKDTTIGEKVWASNNRNNWDTSDLKAYLNDTYYNSIKEPYKNMISNEIYYLGGANNDWDYFTPTDYYQAERSSNVYSGNPITTNQYIGLMYPSDYGYAAGKDCLNTPLFGNRDYDSCRAKNYLSVYIEWLQTPYAEGNGTAAFVGIDGLVLASDTSVIGSLNVRPALYLTQETTIIGGTGTKSDPYIVS